MRHTLLLRNTLSSGKLRSRPVGYAGANAAGGGVNGSRLRPCSIHLRHDHLCRSCHVAELLDAQQPLRDPCRISRRKCRSQPRGRRGCSGASGGPRSCRCAVLLLVPRGFHCPNRAVATRGSRRVRRLLLDMLQSIPPLRLWAASSWCEARRCRYRESVQVGKICRASSQLHCFQRASENCLPTYLALRTFSTRGTLIWES